MTNRGRIPKVALILAASSTAVVAALLGAAALNIGVENMHFHPTPRINTFTVGLGLVPVAALGWIVFMWARKPLDGFLDVLLRVVLTVGLLVGVYNAVGFALFAAFFVG